MAIPDDSGEDEAHIQGNTGAQSIEALAGKFLEAYKAGATGDSFDHLFTREERPLVDALTGSISGTAGDALSADRPGEAAELVLRWAICQLRPDRLPELDVADRAVWLERPSWRPFLALVCQYGFTAVPDFPERYYRRRGESPADNLCGLWGIGASTFYRCVDTAKRRLAQVLRDQLREGRHTGELREFTRAEVYRRKHLDTVTGQREWHRAQASLQMNGHDIVSAIWHLRMAGDFEKVIQSVMLHLVAVARQPGMEEEMAALQREPALSPPAQIQVQLAVAALRRVQNDPEGEREAYERALRLAAQPEDAAGLGMIYSHLGKYYESRDADRAFAYYQESIEFFSRSSQDPGYPGAREEHANTLVQLAWLYTLRNDPRAKGLLERAQALALPARGGEAQAPAALLEQAWGEYWRRTGDFATALEHKLRALHIYERMSDEQGMLKTYINLGVIYDDMKQYDRAKDYYTRVLQLAERIPVDPEHIASTRMNLGACYFWQKDYDAATREYQLALEVSERAGLKLHMGRAHYNLAESYYTRYVSLRRDEDEALGDQHIAAAIEAWEPESYPVYLESARTLKEELLGGTKEHDEHRILPQEKAAHYSEMADVEKQRMILAGDASPEEQIRARLAIASAYIAIAASEREEALQLCEKHNLLGAFAPELDGLLRTFEQSLDQSTKLVKAWHARSQMPEDELRPIVQRLLRDGYLSKSSYAEARRVGPATASKHLGQLAQSGLLVQVGKGASTRYVLP